jgi:predicted porin
VAASYGLNTVEAGAAETETTRTQLSGNWDNRAFGVYGNWWNQETETTGAPATEDRTGWSISGVARFGGRHELYLVWGNQEDDVVGGTSESTLMGISYQHVMSKRTRVYVGYADVDNEAASARSVNFSAAAPAAGFDPRAFQLGLVHTF